MNYEHSHSIQFPLVVTPTCLRNYGLCPEHCSAGFHCYDGDVQGLLYHLCMDCETHNLYFYQTSTFALQLPLIAVQELTVKKIILILSLLEQFKFRLDIKDYHEGRTVFLEACSRLMKRDKQYAAEFPTLVDWFLYSMKFNVNERDNEGWTSLHFIMELKHEEFIIPTLKKLLQHGADPTIEERNGYNPLGYAVYKHELRFIRRLMENIPEFQNDNIIKRAISKTAVFSEKRNYLRTWLYPQLKA
ncbi:14843_t:CDS:1 [Cetraspora pellucida]|uniref:14843_t:CDS:1 n=1 Tax=Cetraspora pellucida TaxID=1433469 RepID=A0ACA9NVT7_9GLOM|nr:14843_t:CDS:1 [Cetraspora pellucida]